MSKQQPKRGIGRPSLSGNREKSRIVSVRMTRDQATRLAELAKRERMSTGEVVRQLLELGYRDPAGTLRAVGASMRQDLGGPAVNVERILVDQVEMERRGQLRLIGG